MARKLASFFWMCLLLPFVNPVFAQTPGLSSNFIGTVTTLPALTAPELSSPSPTLPALVVSKEVREVDVVLSVTDHKGRFVKDLTPSDLTVLDNGERQNTVTFFQSRTDLPLRIALLLDISASVTADFDFERAALGSFLKDILRPNDSAMLIAFHERVRLVQPATANPKDIMHAMPRVKPRGETAVFDAVSRAADFLRQDDSTPSRRIMILVSDGQENSSRATLQQATRRALQAHATIYTIAAQDHWQGSDEAHFGNSLLRTLAQSTDGQTLRASEDGDVSHALSKIRRELRSQYALGYRPSNLSQAGPFHRLKVGAPNSMRVHCRVGYYAR